MTMQIKSTDTIAGVSVMAVRKFFGTILAWHSDCFNLPTLANQLGLTEAQSFPAEQALAGVLERVPLINGDLGKVRMIKTVVVFGGYLAKMTNLAIWTLAVKLVDRNPKDSDRVATMTAYSKKSGRHFNIFLDEFTGRTLKSFRS